MSTDNQKLDKKLKLQKELNSIRTKNQSAKKLINKWMADETGYDEKNWTKVKKAIEKNRTSNRKRFSK